MKLINCQECNTEILERIGTICPNCGHTVSYFEGDAKKKKYGKFFAITVFFPFISFISIVFTSWNIMALSIATILYTIIAIYSCPIRFKELFFTNYEKIFFWGIWVLVNSLLVTMIYNSLSKLI